MAKTLQKGCFTSNNENSYSFRKITLGNSIPNILKLVQYFQKEIKLSFKISPNDAN